ncbi:hypothetical protein LCGC14_0380890 [marine sediment metagenome]|uniref:Uncharacterized protein n=1 Tax=marine sediment metagenome TaxID=412755 RepID=A0A0F9WBD3_9ZZZZ
MRFVWPTVHKFPSLADYENYLESLKTIKEKVKCILNDVPDSNNLSNKEFVFLYLHYVHGFVVPPKLRKVLTDFESIRRMHQKLVEDEPEKYGPTSKAYLAHKATKEVAVMESVTLD